MKIVINIVLAQCILCSVFFTINVGNVYSRWYLRKDVPHVNFSTSTQKTIY